MSDKHRDKRFKFEVDIDSVDAYMIACYFTGKVHGINDPNIVTKYRVQIFNLLENMNTEMYAEYYNLVGSMDLNIASEYFKGEFKDDLEKIAAKAFDPKKAETSETFTMLMVALRGSTHEKNITNEPEIKLDGLEIPAASRTIHGKWVNYGREGYRLDITYYVHEGYKIDVYKQNELICQTAWPDGLPPAKAEGIEFTFKELL